MNEPTAADLASAHRWVRERTVEAIFVAPGAGAEGSPMGRRGLWAGPVLATLVVCVLHWQEPLRAGVSKLVGG
jgi:hypothetical protein